ncbi:hypothetical protein BY458DRAFT_431610, partial [Sporodiniella umbellata]
TKGHYLNSIRKALNDMNKNHVMSGFYIVRNNALIHTHSDIAAMLLFSIQKVLYNIHIINSKSVEIKSL